ncbi:MAG: hypothetical protein U0237_18730 [Thermoleophilia bacterium]
MKSIRRRSIAAALAAASILVAAGCGGSSTSDKPATQTTAALSADQFRQQADAVCADIDTKVSALGEPTSEADIVPFLEKGLAVQNEQLTRLKAITPPSELKAAYDEALGLLQQQTDLITEAKDKIAGGTAAATVLAEYTPKLNDIEAKAKQKASELGLTKCGDTNGTQDGTATATSSVPTTAPVDTTSAPPVTPGQTVGTATFVADIQTFAQTLTQFGLTLQAAADGPDALKQRSSLLRSQLDDFDTVTAKMSGYTVDVPALETKRAAIVAASPDISRLGRELLDAAEAGDATKVASIASEFTTALQRLQTAASS